MTLIDQVFSSMHRQNFLEKQLGSCFDGVVCSGVSQSVLGKFDAAIRKYDMLPRFNIAVCANMSAGKTTLVNALLGKDLLPARNEATTAKVTSVIDRDEMERVFGCCLVKSDEIAAITCADMKQETIEKWNSDPNVARIFLQSDLNGIGNRGRVVVVHDTPGTNNSYDSNHRDVTIGFLKREKVDALIYVVNFENMTSTDQDVLLHDIISIHWFKKSVPVVFVINKLDSADSLKEDVSGCVNRFADYVRRIGFSNYVISPVAAKAGRLFKMALLGNASDFTEKECDEFDGAFRKFTKRVDVRDYIPTASIRRKYRPLYGCRVDKISIGGMKYPVDQLGIALANTGIPALEKLIENLTRN